MKCPGTTDEHCLHPGPYPGVWRCCTTACAAAGRGHAPWSIARGAPLEPTAAGLAVIGTHGFRLLDVENPPGDPCQERTLQVELVTGPAAGGTFWTRQAHVELAPARPAKGFAQGGIVSRRSPVSAGELAALLGCDLARAGMVPRLEPAKPPAPACTCPRLFVDGHVSGCPEKRPPRHVLG